MINLAHQHYLAARNRHTEQLMQKDTILNADIPGTIGFEFEQLYSFGKNTGIVVEIVVKNSDCTDVTLYLPHEYFEFEQPNGVSWIQSGAYAKIMARSSLMKITLDTVIAHAHDDDIRKIFHVLEFITEPFNLTEKLNPTLAFCTNTIKDLYAFCKTKITEDKAILEAWMEQYNQKDYAKDYPMQHYNEQGVHYLRPDNTSDGRTAHCVLNLNENEIEPLMHMHTNVSILMEQMFSLEMREAFPILTTYPEMAEDAKKHQLKNWPSCKPSLQYEAWELALTKDINITIDAFAASNINNVTPYSRQRICGLLRTLVYCFCIPAYCNSTLREEHFPADQYETDYQKDFFLHGYPKAHFDWLVLDGLTQEEKQSLNDLYLKESMRDLLLDSCKGILQKAGLPENSTCDMFVKRNPESVNLQTFLMHALELPLKNGVTTEITHCNSTVESTSPIIYIGSEARIVPVFEFRASINNGCTVQDLESFVNGETCRALKFAQDGFKNKSQYDYQPRNRY